MPDIKFDKSTIPDLAGRVVLVTGGMPSTHHQTPCTILTKTPGTAGIGAELVVELAKHNPSRILFTGRNAQSASSTIQRAKSSLAPTSATEITFIPCDLANLSSVRDAANTIIATTSRLDIFLANAGIMAKPPSLSADGYEIQFATNHLGHALLTLKLLPLLQQTAAIPGADVRVLYTTSAAWRGGALSFDKVKTTHETPVMGRWTRYCNSKLANLLYARELARRYPDILAFSLTPGVVGTGLVNDLGFGDRAFVWVSQLGKILTPEQGTFNHLWGISAARDKVQPGKYYEPVGQLWTKETDKSKDPKLAEELWEWTERELQKWL